MKNLFDQLETGFDIVTGSTCAKIISRIRKIEDSFWTEDLDFDEMNFS